MMNAEIRLTTTLGGRRVGLGGVCGGGDGGRWEEKESTGICKLLPSSWCLCWVMGSEKLIILLKRNKIRSKRRPCLDQW